MKLLSKIMLTGSIFIYVEILRSTSAWQGNGVTLLELQIKSPVGKWAAAGRSEVLGKGRRLVFTVANAYFTANPSQLRRLAYLSNLHLWNKWWEKFIFLFQTAAYSVCASSSAGTLLHHDSVSILTPTTLTTFFLLWTLRTTNKIPNKQPSPQQTQNPNWNLDYLDICSTQNATQKTTSSPTS